MNHFTENEIELLKTLNYRVIGNKVVPNTDGDISVGIVLTEGKYFLTFYEEGEKSSFLKDLVFDSFDETIYFLRNYHGKQAN